MKMSARVVVIGLILISFQVGILDAQTPTVDGKTTCKITTKTTETQCNAMITGPSKCPFVWAGTPCCRKMVGGTCTKYYTDGGCQKLSFCGYNCQSNCLAQTNRCYWNSVTNKCLSGETCIANSFSATTCGYTASPTIQSIFFTTGCTASNCNCVALSGGRGNTCAFGCTKAEPAVPCNDDGTGCGPGEECVSQVDTFSGPEGTPKCCNGQGNFCATTTGCVQV